MSYWWAIGLGAGLAVIFTLGAGGCAMLNPTASDVLKKFCDFHASEISSVLLTPEQQRAGGVVCGAIGLRLGTPD